jgi:hypothetical protein
MPPSPCTVRRLRKQGPLGSLTRRGGRDGAQIAFEVRGASGSVGLRVATAGAHHAPRRRPQRVTSAASFSVTFPRPAVMPCVSCRRCSRAREALLELCGHAFELSGTRISGSNTARSLALSCGEWGALDLVPDPQEGRRVDRDETSLDRDPARRESRNRRRFGDGIDAAQAAATAGADVSRDGDGSDAGTNLVASLEQRPGADPGHRSRRVPPASGDRVQRDLTVLSPLDLAGRELNRFEARTAAIKNFCGFGRPHCSGAPGRFRSLAGSRHPRSSAPSPSLAACTRRRSCRCASNPAPLTACSSVETRHIP